MASLAVRLRQRTSCSEPSTEGNASQDRPDPLRDEVDEPVPLMEELRSSGYRKRIPEINDGQDGDHREDESSPRESRAGEWKPDRHGEGRSCEDKDRLDQPELAPVDSEVRG